MLVDRFHNSWVGSRASVREPFDQFVHYYNTQRPHQSLNGQTLAEVLTKQCPNSSCVTALSS
jgi:putative transposase